MHNKIRLALLVMMLILATFLPTLAEQTMHYVASEAFQAAAAAAYEEGTFIGLASDIDELVWPKNVSGYDKDRYVHVDTPFFGCIVALPEGSSDAGTYSDTIVRVSFDTNSLHVFDSTESINSNNVLKPQSIEIIGGYFDGVITEKDGPTITMTAFYDSDHFQENETRSFIINNQTLVTHYEDSIEETQKTGVPTVTYYRTVGEEFELPIGETCLVLYDDAMTVYAIRMPAG